MFLIIANVLATSYCNLAAPLVCLALLACGVDNFPRGDVPLSFRGKRPRPEADKGKVGRRFRTPIEKLLQEAAEAAEKRHGLLFLILSTTSYCLVKLVWLARRGGAFSPENFDSSVFDLKVL